MKIVCVTVGKKHDRDLRGAIEKYQLRLRAYTDFSFDYVPTDGVDEEYKNILKRISPSDRVILLDETGDFISNAQLAGAIEEYMSQSIKRMVFVIGGAFGVNADLRARSDLIMSLSGLVLPHQLVRLILVEQIYRSFNILAGGKYHHN